MTDASMQVPRFFTWVARSIHRHPRFWIRLGRMESAVLSIDLAEKPVVAPIYVCGLARGGTTLALEMLAAHPDTASHRYQDFPFVLTPYWWQLVLKLSPFKSEALRERAHGDGMLVNAASPEAMEEMLWMAFFPQAHDVGSTQVLGRGLARVDFAVFYRKHIQKLLLAGKANRYVSKGNYNLTRMGYLRQLFPDSRFVVPVREPSAQIASLMRQHKRFCEAGKNDAAVAEHMALAGHFEFGLKRTPINTGDAARLREVQAAWEAGDEIRGWALYWDMLYRFVHEQLAADSDLCSATQILRFETLCEQPEATIRALFAHCHLSENAALVAKFAAQVQKPDYYDAGFTPEQLATIRAITGETAKHFGY
ncbi:MAG: sulfotransferase [Proteobacteria bacterium]|nr:sulfotransferase [Pseudomonadota bacterium]